MWSKSCLFLTNLFLEEIILKLWILKTKYYKNIFSLKMSFWYTRKKKKITQLTMNFHFSKHTYCVFPMSKRKVALTPPKLTRSIIAVLLMISVWHRITFGWFSINKCCISRVTFHLNLLIMLPHVSEKRFPQHTATPDRFQALSPLPAITWGAFTKVCQRQTPLNQMRNYNKMHVALRQ